MALTSNVHLIYNLSSNGIELLTEWLLVPQILNSEGSGQPGSATNGLGAGAAQHVDTESNCSDGNVGRSGRPQNKQLMGKVINQHQGSG